MTTTRTATTIPTKFCGLCERDLPRDKFELDLRRRDGRKATCTECRKALGVAR